MATWLLKTEPGDYAFDDLVRDKKTTWNGVTSNAAVKHMRGVKKGDIAIIYHTGNERCIVGTATVTKGAYPDPDNTDLNSRGEPKIVVFDIKAGTRATRQCTLAEIKADKRFEGYALVREPRLSVMPVPDALAKVFVKMAGLKV